MKRAGAGVPSANRITLLRDADGDGVAETRTVFLDGAEFAVRDGAGRQRPLRRQHRRAAALSATTPARRGSRRPASKVIDLPAGPINHHWTKNVIASPDGTKLYVTVGSNSNVGENGIDGGERARRDLGGRSRDRPASRLRVRACAIRTAWRGSRHSGALWTVVNERDELGNDLVPDYMTAVRDGAFYGWPYSYYGQHVDKRVQPQRPDLVAKAIVPDYALGPHTASLGLAFCDGAQPAPSSTRTARSSASTARGTASRRSGYKVIFVPFAGGQPGRPAGRRADRLPRRRR